MEKKAAAHFGTKGFFQVFFILLFLFLTSLASYAAFYALVEIVSIIIAFSIFLLAWSSRRFHEHDFVLYLGIAFLFIAGIDLIHLFISPEFAIIKGYDENLSQQLRIAGRFLESVSFFLAFSALAKKIQVSTIFWGYLVVFVSFLFSILFWKSFPSAYSFESGATLFKNASDYVTILIFAGALATLFKRRKEFSPLLVQLFSLAIIFQAAGVAIHTPYNGSQSLSNFLGLSFRLVAFFLLYKAIIEIGLMDPYSLLFRSLLKKEKLLEDSEKRYRTVADNTHDWEFWINPEHESIYVSPSVKIITGRPAEEFLSNPHLIQEIIYADDRRLFEKHSLQTENLKKSGHLEFRIVHSNGSVRWIAHVCRPIFDANGNFLGIRGSNRDVTSLKAAEEKLKVLFRGMEEKVKYRTKELREVNRQLENDKEQLIESYRYLGIANRKISILLDLFRAPGGKRNKQIILNYIISTILNISHANEGLLYSYDENKKYFKLLIAKNVKNGSEKSLEIILEKDNDLLKAFRNNLRRINGEIKGKHREIFGGGKKLKYFMALLLEKDKRLVGLILLRFENKKSISHQDFEFYDIFTIIASQTLANENIYN